MTPPSSQYPYSLRETEQFGNQWSHAVRLGYINPMVDPANLAYIRERLAENPYLVMQMTNDVPANRCLVSLNSRVRLWYSIIVGPCKNYERSDGSLLALRILPFPAAFFDSSHCNGIRRCSRNSGARHIRHGHDVILLEAVKGRSSRW